ncbi:MAG: flagellar biosynthetic protein FliO [Hahellaceae bacterium]|nr:flagellar biosynthetic protein FliO [Hahellaceae bacterium]
METTVMGISQAGQVVAALATVVALIMVTAWFMRRFVGISGGAGKQLRVIAAISVGNRERIAVVDVAGRQIVVGITAQQISSLGELEEPIDNPEAEGEFARNLQKLLRRSDSDVKGELDELR